MANTELVEKPSNKEKFSGEPKVASTTVSKETQNDQSRNKQEPATTEPGTVIPESIKEPDSSVKQTQNQPNIEKKKEATPSESSAQPAQTMVTKKDQVIYRVQILANTRAVGSQNITIAGKSYKSFEYLYMGGYRTTIGEFSNLYEASRFQAICRQNGYSQAFVVAFKNNVRSNDPELFK
jgi:hypothetical protein